VSVATTRTRIRRRRILNLLAGVAVAVVLVLMPPALPSFGPSLLTPLTTSTLSQLALLLAWLVLLLLAVALLRRGVAPASPAPPSWASRSPRARARARSAQLVELRSQPSLTIPRPPVLEHDAAGDDREEAGQPDRERGERPVVATIALLGPVAIEGVRRPRRAATLELLAYLALHPAGARSDEVLEAMWPGEDPQQTRPRLYQSVSEARRLLGDDALVRDGDRYRLDRARIAIDVDQLEQLLRRLEDPAASSDDALERALELWRGEPLAGSDYAWSDGYIHQLEATLAALAEQGARSRLADDDARGALQLAERGLALDSLNETFVRLALESEAALGQRERVTERYEEFSRLLDQTLGLEPQRETRATYRKLLGQEHT
jgi:DNA-binding SARP family transcriptional activator